MAEAEKSKALFCMKNINQFNEMGTPSIFPPFPPVDAQGKERKIGKIGKELNCQKNIKSKATHTLQKSIIAQTMTYRKNSQNRPIDITTHPLPS